MKKINWQYAIGEIAIVIIGITIAFGLNNWAAGRKDNALEKRYLKNLILDLEIDAAVLEENVEKIGQDLNILGALMPHLKAQLPRRDTMVRKFFKLAEPVDFIPNNITYQTLINSGDFKVIADFELKSGIERHYGTYKIMARDYLRYDNFSKEFLAPFFVNELDFDNIMKGDFSFFDHKNLKGMMKSLQGINYIKLASSQKALESCKQLMEILKAKIDA